MTYRVIVIDPRMRRVIEGSLPEEEAANLAALQSLVGGYIEIACQFNNGDILFVNEEGLLHGEDASFAIVGYTAWLVGQGVIVGASGPDTRSARTTIDELSPILRFARRVPT